MSQIENPKSKIENDAGTGLPLLSNWPAVYVFVLAVFILMVVALTLFTRAYS